MHLTSTRRLWIQWTVVLAVGIFFIPGMRLAARQKKRTHHARRAVHHRRRFHRYRRRFRYRDRASYLARHIAPKRIKQIQQALVKAGDLQEKPNGRWDAATARAMRQYQTDNGFTPTGAPEAKPLMKLGLGPHPLPPSLDRAAAADARAQADNASSVAPDSPPSEKSSSTTSQ